ncbi:uncharacterized protein B0H18DRAFT_959348 [Fomitopsis serialis]|uniref:uncharacterized protein n=1 Tax=Fomitopsis serialis TaxID=139415 RepID=UPI0020081F34|nr:uncharacterized protein B0H18DRAFT_959348 [Neoantrodia serialis]KAH9915360.1 hypothetical protein B0H18DRAFT_959348 [Neoantrodia serialis]
MPHGKVSPAQAAAWEEAFLVFCAQFVQTPAFRLLEEELVKQTQGGPAELSASAPLLEFMRQSSGPTHEKLPVPLQRALEHQEAKVVLLHKLQKRVTEKLGLKEPTEATKVEAHEAMTCWGEGHSWQYDPFCWIHVNLIQIVEDSVHHFPRPFKMHNKAQKVGKKQGKVTAFRSSGHKGPKESTRSLVIVQSVHTQSSATKHDNVRNKRSPECGEKAL